MASPVSHGSESREQIRYAGRRIQNLYSRRRSDGTLVYEFAGKVGGRRRRLTLSATSAKEAVLEVDRIRPAVRAGETGDRSIRLEPLYCEMVVAMRAGEFTYGGRPYATRTVDLLEQRAETHLLDLLGRGTRVADIKAAHLRKAMRRLSAKGLSGSTVRSCMAAASAILRFAAENEIVERNVALDLGRGERPSSKRMSEPYYLSVPDVIAVLEKMSPESRPIAAAMFYGGMRVSEALALRWEDVGADTLTIRGTKTEASYDLIPLLPPLAAELRTHRERSARIGFGRVGPGELVFQTASGRSVSRRNVLRAVSRAGLAAGVSTEERPLGNHDLRHSLAANALGLGLTMTETSRLLRHASPLVTSQVYAGLTDDGLEGIAAKLAAL
jgi:integrase